MTRKWIVIWLVAAAAVAYWFSSAERTRESEPVAATVDNRAEAERRAGIRRFWKAFNEATRLRVDGHWGEAATAYAEALREDREHLDSLYYLGNVLFEMGDYAGAIRTWSRLLEVDPRSSRAHVQLGMVHACGAEGAPFDLARAAAEFSQALEINGEETGPLIKLGEIAVLRGAHGEAEGYLSDATRANPGSVAAHYLLGYVYWLENRPERALAALRSAAAKSVSSASGPSASNEGQTRSGSKPMLVRGARPKSPLETRWNNLESWDGEVGAAAMTREYRRLRALLAELR